MRKLKPFSIVKGPPGEPAAEKTQIGVFRSEPQAASCGGEIYISSKDDNSHPVLKGHEITIIAQHPSKGTGVVVDGRT